jgi:hypothetical protein
MVSICFFSGTSFKFSQDLIKRFFLRRIFLTGLSPILCLYLFCVWEKRKNLFVFFVGLGEEKFICIFREFGRSEIYLYLFCEFGLDQIAYE